ncbi:MAG: ABC transporter permease subunit [Pseudolabrys sp.]|nr:ABC transporter permease subunit [Pseudolabrys sp.]
MRIFNPRQHALHLQVLWIRVFTIIALVALWEFAARSGFFYEGVIPPTWAVIVALAQELMAKDFYYDLGLTVFAATAGFLAGSLIALVLGIMLGLQPFGRRVFEPFITALGGTPKVIFLPIIFLVFGLGIESKIAKASLSAFFPVVLSTTSAFVQIPKILLLTGRSFNLSSWQMAMKVYLPAMANPVLTSLRLAMSMSIIGVLSAEIANSQGGLGFRLIRYADQFRIASVYADAILIFATAAGMNFILSWLQGFHGNRGRKKNAERAADKAALAATSGA